MPDQSRDIEYGFESLAQLREAERMPEDYVDRAVIVAACRLIERGLADIARALALFRSTAYVSGAEAPPSPASDPSGSPDRPASAEPTPR